MYSTAWFMNTDIHVGYKIQHPKNYDFHIYFLENQANETLENRVDETR